MQNAVAQAALECGAALDIIASALRLSQGVIQDHPEELGAQLLGRIRHTKSKAVRRLLEDALRLK